jgi:uncharacterized membrane protein
MEEGEIMMANVGPLELLFGLFFLVLAMAWIILPFALSGLKPILRELLAETKKANEQRDRLKPL